MRLIPLLVVLSVTPAFGQSLAELAREEATRRQAIGRAGVVLTNADLKVAPAVPFQRPVLRPSAIYERFLERQAARDLVPLGPNIVIFGSPTAGPFGEFKPFDPPRRLDGTLLSDPPWSITTFGWPIFGGWHHRATVSRPLTIP